MSSDLMNLLFGFDPDDQELTNIDYDHHARTFAKTLASVSAAQMNKGADTPQDVLELLNPTKNTIAYAVALHKRIEAAGENPKSARAIPDQLKPGGSGWNYLVLFLETFDPIQIRYVGTEYRVILEYVEQAARVLQSPGIAIAPIRSAMLQLDPSTGTFTSIHLNFIRLCMEGRAYAAAVPILGNYIHSIPSRIPKPVETLEGSVPCAEHTNSSHYIHSSSGHSDRISVTDVQEYYLLGAMAYIGLRRWKKAMQFLEHVLVTPTNNLANGLMLEAYKKWVLTSCLATGSLSDPPRTANTIAMKHVRNASKAYEALAEAFSAAIDDENTGPKAIQKLRSQMNRGASIWDEDGNSGLVRELLDQHYKLLITGLSSRFSAIPFADVAEYTGSSVEELVPYVKKLISDGEVNAVIEELGNGTGLLVLKFFLDPTHGPLAKTEKEQHQALLEQTQRTSLLAAQVKDADYRLSLGKEYMEYTKRKLNKPEGMDPNWDSSLEADEDMMGDLQY